MAMMATTPADILRFVLARADEGVASILVTLAGIEGASPRAIGAQMAVAADGRYAGSFSGGCIEAAVVAEAIGTLADGRAKLVRFGAGSPYFDIRLPCGSGLDLLFNPVPAAAVIAAALRRHEQREVAVLRLANGGVHLWDDAPPHAGTGWVREDFQLCYRPALRIVALGQGEELCALARLGGAFGADIDVFSPDLRALADLRAEGFETCELAIRTQLPPITADPSTAIVFLFHDHDWEDYLLPWALGLPGFYVGAMGSRRTQQIRRDSLRAAGVSEALCQRLRTSVGLIPATRDPATLALSVLAEIAQEFQRLGNRLVAVDAGGDIVDAGGSGPAFAQIS